MEDNAFARKTQEELDDILNSALDELEDEDDFATMGTEGRAAQHTTPSVRKMEEEASEDVAKNLERLLAQMDDPDVMASLEATFKHLGETRDGSEDISAMAAADAAAAAAAGASGGDAGAHARGEGAHVPKAGQEGETEVDRTVMKTLEALSKAAADMEGQDMGEVEGAGEDIMKHMLEEFEKLGEKEDYDNVMDDMLRQLLSREMMYEPLRQICDKYPEWLATHRERLPDEDYRRYGAQYQCMQHVLAVYDTEPENFPRLMALMQDMQEHGQVPAEIVKDLAPGLDFNGEGMPVMPNLGEGMMPNLPGMQGVDPQNCAVQ